MSSQPITLPDGTEVSLVDGLKHWSEEMQRCSLVMEAEGAGPEIVRGNRLLAAALTIAAARIRELEAVLQSAHDVMCQATFGQKKELDWAIEKCRKVLP